MKPELPLDQIADAILDGAPVDWSIIESTDAIGASAVSDAALVEQLKTLETLRRRRRSNLVPLAPDSWTWGHLQVLERIGQGAYGDVHRAWDTRLDREVALKLLPSDVPAAGLSHSTIIEEGRLLARVRHPNVVTIDGAERIDGRVGLWMELVKGRTLEEALREGRTFTAPEVTKLGVALCQAVSAVHAAGLLHRDIKAQNVMLDDGGRPVLMDFGTGRELGTVDGQIAGTPLYLAPEVLSGRAATPQSDVYGIGVLLYRLLTNTYPVSGTDMAALRRAHADHSGADARRDYPEIPKHLRRVIGRAIDPDPAQRYASAEEFGTALGFADNMTARRRTAYYIAAAAVVVIALGWIAWGRSDLFGPKLSAVGSVVSTDSPMILVLPFKNLNLSAGPDSEYFVDGLTSEVIRNLSEIDGLQVKSTTSTFWFKNRPRSLAAISEQFPGVDLLVDADALRIGNRVRINASVVRVAGDVPIWTKRFDKTIDDVYAIQEEIARVIVNELRLTLGKGQRRYKTSVEASDLYYRARGVKAGRTSERVAEATRLFRLAIEADPNFAPAYAGLAAVYQDKGWNLSTADWPGMAAAARKAFELDPMLPEAVAAMGLTYAYERDWANSVRSFERAIELDPNLTLTYLSYSDALVLMEQPERALQLLEQARAMDPFSVPVHRDLGFILFILGRYEDAITTGKEVLSANPETTHLQLTRYLMMAGQYQEAIALFKSRPGNSEWERWLARAYFMTGQKAEVARVFAEQKTAWHQAIVYAAIGDKDRTFEALERAAKDPNWADRVVSALFVPEFAFLRGDPRRDPLKRELGLPVER